MVDSAVRCDTPLEIKTVLICSSSNSHVPLKHRVIWYRHKMRGLMGKRQVAQSAFGTTLLKCTKVTRKIPLLSYVPACGLWWPTIMVSARIDVGYSSNYKAETTAFNLKRTDTTARSQSPNPKQT